MMQIIEIAKAVFSLLPALIAAMKAVEEAIPGQGQGEQKLAAIRAVLESVYGVVGSASVPFDLLWSAVQRVIATLVPMLFRKAG